MTSHLWYLCRSSCVSSASSDDISQSVSKLSCLGAGFVLLPIGGPKNLAQHILKSVPLEMNVDHLALLSFASGDAAASSSSSSEVGCIRPSEVMRKLSWSHQRLQTCITLLVAEGMVWIDGQDSETTYWFPALAMQ